MRKGADDDRDAHHRPRHTRKDSIPSFPVHLPHLKSPDAATAAARTPRQSPAIISTHRFPASIFSQYLSQGESHGRCSLLPRTPCPRLDLSPFTPRSRAASAPRQRTRPQRHPRPARNRIHPFRARCGARLSQYVLALRRPPDVLRDGGIRPSPEAAPAGGLLARHRIAIARFGTDVAAAGGIGPALTAGLDPAGYPLVPGGVPQAWERAQVYLGLCERYQELYQAQVAGLHLLMATVPAPSDPRPAAAG